MQSLSDTKKVSLVLVQSNIIRSGIKRDYIQIVAASLKERLHVLQRNQDSECLITLALPAL